ncbi:hypothetical protein QE152_g35928 [Popillia japonica]|uniref:Uncharacterized protein n=1 Tax=Popillia japonica TaxID=7064 RepID=A0AAW1IER0_POPJA
MTGKRKLTERELEYAIENWSDFSSCEEEPYSAGSSDDYVPESNSESEYVFDQGVLDDEYESEPDIDICEPEEIPLNEAQLS